MKLRRPTPLDLAYCGVLGFLTFLTGRVWWLTAIVPGQDYPQFLVFVRAAEDHTDPASPFHGTYTLAPWYIPTVLPTQLARLLAVLCGGSIESGTKLLLTLQNVAMVAAGAYLLRVLKRPRWAIVLLFPLIHSRWTVGGGYVAYATSFPLIVLGWAFVVRWFERRDVTMGVLLAACLSLALLWHGIAFAVLGLGFTGLWILWRAPSLRTRALSLLPTVPSLTLFAVWIGSTFRSKAESSRWRWRQPWEAADGILYHVCPTTPHATALALLLCVLLVGGLLVARRNMGASESGVRPWRVDNPFLFVAALYLIFYFILPIDALSVEVLSPRLSIQAATAAVFAWNLPSARVARTTVVAAVAAFAALCLVDVAICFRAFDVETRGASYLIDRIGRHETLYHWPPQGGASAAFGTPNRMLVELQQFSTARHGGLPNSSFAGYGVNYVRYVNGNPMPFLRTPPSWTRDMRRFDYVLVRAGQGPSDPHFQRIDAREGWELYAVCGSQRFPVCASSGT